jgi:uncharacterized protein
MKSHQIGLATLLASLAAPALAASFDCSQARTPVERAICADPSLSAQDEQLAMLFQRAKQHGEPAQVISWQKTWLKDRRNTCKDLACLKLHYQLQLRLLSPIANAVGQGMPWTGRYIAHASPNGETYSRIRLYIRQSSAAEAEFDFVGTNTTPAGEVLTNGMHGKVKLYGNRGRFDQEGCELLFYRHQSGEVSIDQSRGCNLLGAYIAIGHDYRRMSARTPLFEYQALFGEFFEYD